MASNLVLKAWMSENFEDFVGAFGVPPETIEFSCNVGGEPFSALFLRSPVYTNWIEHPAFPELVARASSSALPLLERAVKGRSWRPANFNGSLYIGTDGFNTVGRTRIGEGTLTELAAQIDRYSRYREVTTNGGYFITNPLPSNLNEALAVPAVKDVFSAFGQSFLGAPTDAVLFDEASVSVLECPLPNAAVGNHMNRRWVSGNADSNLELKLLRYFGPGRVVITVPLTNDPNAGLTGRLVAFSYPMFDNETLYLTMNLGSFVRPSATAMDRLSARTETVNTYRYRSNSSEPYVDYYVANVDIPSEEGGLSSSFTRLGALLQDPSVWLPLLGPPGQYEFAIRCTDADVTIESDELLGWKHTRVTAVGDVLTGVPVQWYSDYIYEHATAVNKKEMDAALVALQEYSGQTLCCVSMATPWDIPVNAVERLSLYREYKKAREKACEDNDFMSKTYSEGVTFEAVQTKLNKLGKITEVFSYRDTSLNSSIDLSDAWLWTGWKLVWDAPAKVVRTTRPDTTAGPVLTASDLEDIIEMNFGGATLTGGTISEVVVALGGSATDLMSRSAGFEESKRSLQMANDAPGTDTGYTHFGWESVGLNGYPDVTKMTTDSAIRAVMLSVVCVAPLATKMRKLLLSFGRDSMIRSALVPPAKPSQP